MEQEVALPSIVSPNTRAYESALQTEIPTNQIPRALPWAVMIEPVGL